MTTATKVQRKLLIGAVYVHRINGKRAKKICLAVGSHTLLTVSPISRKPKLIDTKRVKKFPKPYENIDRVEMSVKDLCATWHISQSQLDLLTQKFLSPRPEGRKNEDRRSPIWLQQLLNSANLRRKFSH